MSRDARNNLTDDEKQQVYSDTCPRCGGYCAPYFDWDGENWDDTDTKGIGRYLVSSRCENAECFELYLYYFTEDGNFMWFNR